VTGDGGRRAPKLESLPVVVIGAGPVGLAAAAELHARALPFLVLEAGPGVATSVRAWSHVPFFSPWAYVLSRAALPLLAETGWRGPEPDSYPTGADLLQRYLEPLAAHAAIAPHLRFDQRVVAIARTAVGKVRDADRETQPFEVRTVDCHGREARLLARAVVDCSGTWTKPNPAGASGLPALGEAANAANIRYSMTDVLGAERPRYANRRVAVLGAGHSAAGTLLDLANLAQEAPRTSIIWLLRRRDFGTVFGSDRDQLSERGALGQRLKALADSGRMEIVAPFAVDRIERSEGRLLLHATDAAGTAMADELIVSTGFRPDLSFLGELRLDLDPALECPRTLAPLIDPNLHSCGTVRPHGARELEQPEAEFFLAGMKSYGRAPTFLLLTGYEQVRSIVAQLAGDRRAAERVELELPETGVCNGPAARTEAVCCGPDTGASCNLPGQRQKEAVG
jgi:thioredoxin reductase